MTESIPEDSAGGGEALTSSPSSVFDQTSQKLFWIVLAIVWLACALYALAYLKRGWVPHDDGTLAQSAERVLRGQLPHGDFDEVYTGGLSLANAAAFRVLGSSLLTLRVLLYVVFLAWIPALYYIATRITTPIWAGGVVVLGAVWSIPNYPAAMPSWYNLFLATFGIAAVFRYLECERPRWLFLAGVSAGLSCLVKVVGLYFVGAVLLFLLYREQLSSAGVSPRSARNSRLYSSFVSAGLAAFVIALVALVRREPTSGAIVEFVLPGTAIASFLVWNEWSTAAVLRTSRFRALFGTISPFAAGVMLPVLIFLVPYVHAHALKALYEGVFVVPMSRFEFASLPPQAAWKLAVGALLLLGVFGFLGVADGSGLRWLLWTALAASIALVGRFGILYKLIWTSMWSLLPVVVGGGLLLLLISSGQLDTIRRQHVFLLISSAALCGIVGYPFAMSVYFLYVGAIVVLAAAAVIGSSPFARTSAPAGLLLFYLVFALRVVHGINGIAGYQNVVPLPLSRAGIDVPPGDSIVYTALQREVPRHARGGYAFCTPDCPEVYFLSGLRNPTRILFDFLDASTNRDDRILQTLSEHGVSVIVLNDGRTHSGATPRDLYERLVRLYPDSERIGLFTVRWHE